MAQGGQAVAAPAGSGQVFSTFKSDIGGRLDVPLGPNQYLGRSNAGMGAEMVVRLTVDDAGAIRNIEIVSQSETGQIAGEALKKLPEEMIARNTYDVDAVSGASVSSRALKDAVKDALSQVPARQQ